MLEYRTERFIHPVSIDTPLYLCQPPVISFNINYIRVTLQILVKPGQAFKLQLLGSIHQIIGRKIRKLNPVITAIRKA